MTTYTFDASFITEIAIIVLWAGLVYYTYFAFKGSGHTNRKALIISGAILVWSIWAFGSVKYEFDVLALSRLPQFARVPIVLIPVIGLTLLLGRWLVGDGLSQRWLIGLQIVRVIGLVFVIEHLRGNLPGIFAWPAGLGDFLTAIIALGVLLTYKNRPIPTSAIWLVFTVGILDFISAIFFGITSSETPMQLFAFTNPNQVLLYPTGLIPFFGVPYAIIFHILSILELKRSQK